MNFLGSDVSLCPRTVIYLTVQTIAFIVRFANYDHPPSTDTTENTEREYWATPFMTVDRAQR